jgi:prolyl oligopeptidase
MIRKQSCCALVCLVSAVSSAAVWADGKPRTVPHYDARTFFETTTVFGTSFSADESKMLLTTDASGVFNVYSQPLAGGKPTMLTKSTTNATMGVSWFPNDDRFLYTADEGGNELNHVYVRELDGTAKDLTPGPKVKASFAGWSGDRKYFYITTNERDSNHFDLYRYATEGYERKLVFENHGGWMVAGVSRDGHWIALNKIRNNADSDVFLADTTAPKSEPRHITPHKGNVTHGFATFSADSKHLYYSTNEAGEFDQVWSYAIESGQRTPAISANWDVSYVRFSETGRYRVSGVNQDARTVVTILDTTTGREVKLPKLPPGDLGGVNFSRSEKHLALYINSDTSPSNLHVINLEKGTQTQLSNSINPKIDPANLVTGEVVRFKSFDGKEIPSILYRPWPASKTNKVPALVWVHGGPGGQSRTGYRAMMQHLVNHGYAILAVNNRGSSGYGKTFYHLDDRDHGGGDLQDCVWGRKHLETLDWVDGDKIGIIGGSYGGYMVAAALTFEPEVFDVGVNIFGVTNWVRTMNEIPDWWADFREYLVAEIGDPVRDAEKLKARSPLFHAKNIVSPWSTSSSPTKGTVSASA